MSFGKKIFVFILIIITMLPPFIEPLIIKVSAKTLNDLYNELNKLEETENKNKSNIKKTEAEIEQTRNDIKDIYVKMDEISNEIITKTKEIEELSLEIIKKDEETKELMKFLQISTGNSIYLEYIMGADTLSNFIYRIAITEQLTKYNNELIKEMNAMIEANRLKKEELKQKEKDLELKQVELKKKVNLLGNEKSKLYEFEQNIVEEIKIAREVIKMYEDAGCGLNEDINICANRILPPDTRFWRPLVQGYITSEYGNRLHPIYGDWRLHDGIDMSNSDKQNTKVYASANGKVAKIGYDSSRGNYIVIHHYINGKNYTTTYLHLKTGSIKVKAGEVVSKNTVLATMGTTGSSTGEHLHFSIASGLWFKDYVSYYDFVNKTVNPRIHVNFPSSRYVYWYDRITKYN